ncbi:hypothetical protein GCM10011505_26850 [Tistrella bauzanensis]|uniref:DUF4352 domain-containing protein n=1 Tax=Tistrella bauzanensis TaxID=657419 RepID=A0ABQ1IKX8_9PROT|nr:hypothetical protein [Tistrella bauzanensis]GGB44151.1 hypothetical protein GCM10011505_26850 [Tistrella bauzanensis]
MRRGRHARAAALRARAASLYSGAYLHAHAATITERFVVAQPNSASGPGTTLKTGGRGRRRLLGAAAIALAATTAGCGAFSRAEPPVCPRVVVLRETSQAVQIVPGATDVTGVRFLGRIADAQWNCDADTDDGRRYIDVALTLVIDVERGPAAPGDTGTAFDYYVAVTDRDQTILNKQVFRSDLPLPADRLKAAAQEELSIRVPLTAGTSGADYALMVGFQLSPEQLEFQRGHARAVR